MYGVPPDLARWPAAGAPLERGVTRPIASSLLSALKAVTGLWRVLKRFLDLELDGTAEAASMYHDFTPWEAGQIGAKTMSV
jgi:hypothetical protein